MSKRPRTNSKASAKNEAPPARDLASRARHHWTEAQTTKLTGGKRYPLLPVDAPELLRELGLLNQDASMSADAVRKYSQINHLLLQLTPALEALAGQHQVVRLLDAGAGKSYLGFLLAWAFKSLWHKPCEILGVDSHARLMREAAERSGRLGYSESLRFSTAPLAEFNWQTAQQEHFPAAVSAVENAKAVKSIRPHAVLALHACDTATDEALALGIKLKSDFIAVVPCCQAELAAQWKELTQAPTLKEHPLAPVFHAPELRREIAADCTDMLRVLLLRAHGYEVTSTEFVSADHTPKNRLIMATRRGNYLDSAKAEYARLKEHLGGGVIKLETLLRD